VARATLESIPLAEVAKLRGWSSRRTLILLALLVAVGIAVAAIASGGGDAPQTGAHDPGHAQSPVPAAQLRAAPIAEPAVTADEPARDPATPRSIVEPSNGAPASAPKESRPSKSAAPKAAAAGIKDYGI